MKTESEIHQELQKVRTLRGNYESSNIRGSHVDILHGAQQALGWVLDLLKSPSDSDDMKRRQAHDRRRGALRGMNDRSQMR